MLKLNINQKNFYKKNGYLHISNLFTKKDLNNAIVEFKKWKIC